MKEVLSSFETLVLTRATLRNIPEDEILHNLSMQIFALIICRRIETGYIVQRYLTISDIEFVALHRVFCGLPNLLQGPSQAFSFPYNNALIKTPTIQQARSLAPITLCPLTARSFSPETSLYLCLTVPLKTIIYRPKFHLEAYRTQCRSMRCLRNSKHKNDTTCIKETITASDKKDEWMTRKLMGKKWKSKKWRNNIKNKRENVRMKELNTKGDGKAEILPL
jgi:hypothetical protein